MAYYGLFKQHLNVLKTFIGKMDVGSRSESVVVKEMNEYSEEELNKILSVGRSKKTSVVKLTHILSLLQREMRFDY